jgi:hypothetical protein
LQTGKTEKRGDTMKRKMKRLIALTLVLLMSLSLLSATAWAAETEETSEVQSSNVEAADELEVEVQSTKSGKCGKNVTWKLDSDGTLTISGTGKMYDYSYDDDYEYTTPWYDISVKKVVIKDGVTSIGSYAFVESSLKSVTIPSSVKTIGESAFQMSALSSVTIPNGVTSIGDYAFDMSDLTSVTLSGSVKSIGESAFADCDLVSVIIPEGVQKIGDAAFCECSLMNVVIPSSVTSIGDYAFGGMYSFTVYFKGNAPQLYKGNGIDEGVFLDSDVTVYYPANNSTWTSSVRKSYGAEKITWKTWYPEKNVVQPVLKSLSNISEGVKVTWSKAENAKKYEVYRSTNGGGYSRVKTTTSTSWTDESVKSGTKYSYKIYGINDDYESKPSNSKSIYFVSVPSLSSVTNSKGKKMVVKWKKISSASGYEIQYSTNSSFSGAKKITVSKNSTVSKTISSLTKGKKYYVRIRSYKKSGDSKYYSAWSGSKNVKISK